MAVITLLKTHDAFPNLSKEILQSILNVHEQAVTESDKRLLEGLFSIASETPTHFLSFIRRLTDSEAIRTKDRVLCWADVLDFVFDKPESSIQVVIKHLAGSAVEMVGALLFFYRHGLSKWYQAILETNFSLNIGFGDEIKSLYDLLNKLKGQLEEPFDAEIVRILDMGKNTAAGLRGQDSLSLIGDPMIGPLLEPKPLSHKALPEVSFNEPAQLSRLVAFIGESYLLEKLFWVIKLRHLSDSELSSVFKKESLINFLNLENAIKAFIGNVKDRALLIRLFKGILKEDSVNLFLPVTRAIIHRFFKKSALVELSRQGFHWQVLCLMIDNVNQYLNQDGIGAVLERTLSPEALPYALVVTYSSQVFKPYEQKVYANAFDIIAANLDFKWKYTEVILAVLKERYEKSNIHCKQVLDGALASIQAYLPKDGILTQDTFQKIKAVFKTKIPLITMMQPFLEGFHPIPGDNIEFQGFIIDACFKTNPTLDVLQVISEIVYPEEESKEINNDARMQRLIESLFEVLIYTKNRSLQEMIIEQLRAVDVSPIKEKLKASNWVDIIVGDYPLGIRALSSENHTLLNDAHFFGDSVSPDEKYHRHQQMEKVILDKHKKTVLDYLIEYGVAACRAYLSYFTPEDIYKMLSVMQKYHVFSENNEFNFIEEHVSFHNLYLLPDLATWVFERLRPELRQKAILLEDLLGKNTLVRACNVPDMLQFYLNHLPVNKRYDALFRRPTYLDTTYSVYKRILFHLNGRETLSDDLLFAVLNTLAKEEREALLLQKNYEGLYMLLLVAEDDLKLLKDDVKAKYPILFEGLAASSPKTLFDLLLGQISVEKLRQVLLETNHDIELALLSAVENTPHHLSAVLNCLLRNRADKIAVYKKNEGLKSGHNLLQRVSDNAESLAVVLNKLSPDVRKTLLMDKTPDNKNILHLAAKNVKAFKVIMRELTVDERNRFLHQKDNSGNTPLMRTLWQSVDAFSCALSYYSTDEHFKMITDKNKIGESVLTYCAKARGYQEKLFQSVSPQVALRLAFTKTSKHRYFFQTWSAGEVLNAQFKTKVFTSLPLIKAVYNRHRVSKHPFCFFLRASRDSIGVMALWTDILSSKTVSQIENAILSCLEDEAVSDSLKHELFDAMGVTFDEAIEKRLSANKAQMSDISGADDTAKTNDSTAVESAVASM